MTVSVLLAGFVALSVHVGLLAAGVPFPQFQPPGWARWLHLSFIIAGAIAFLDYARQTMRNNGILSQTVLAFLVIACIQETARAAIMTGVVTGGWAFAAIGLARSYILVLISALLSVLAARLVRGSWSILVVSLVTGGLAMGGRQLATMALTPVLAYAETLARPDLYAFPYPFHVTVAAYLTFAEPVLGATIMVMLAWNGLPSSRLKRVAILALLAALIKGIVGGTFVFGFFAGPSPAMGMFSASQFLLEFLTLGLLVGLAWEAFGARRQRASHISKGEQPGS